MTVGTRAKMEHFESAFERTMKSPEVVAAQEIHAAARRCLDGLSMPLSA
jgi:hypothetical protein